MQYLYNKNSGTHELYIDGEDYKYLFKVKRISVGKELGFRNLIDFNLYIYKIVEVNKKEAKAILSETIFSTSSNISNLEIGWCIIDNKIIEKNIHMLNELGVKKISFIYCDRSQKNFKINFERLEKILINSSMQCGRNILMELEIVDSIDKYVDKYNEIVVIDFCEEKLCSDKNIKNILIGPEGGFSQYEKGLLNKFKKLGFNTKYILRSETAIICATSIIIA